MTLPASGAISFNNINVELGVSGTTQASLGQTSYRTLAGVPSGAISMSNFYGKANAFAFTISSNQTNANLRTLAVNAGWNQSTKVIATVGSGVYISSNSTGTPALTVDGSFPGGVELVNSGTIVGMGGNGGSSNFTGNAGASGGLALSVTVAVTITNNATIAGGGGGGGGGGAGGQYVGKGAIFCGGGGGGGGRSSNASNSSGGSATPQASSDSCQPGSAGTVSSAGAGGAGGSASFWGVGKIGGNGGSGGGWGSSGSSGSGGGGNYANQSGAGGGSGGGAITGNSNITWVATGTRLGSIS